MPRLREPAWLHSLQRSRPWPKAKLLRRPSPHRRRPRKQAKRIPRPRPRLRRLEQLSHLHILRQVAGRLAAAVLGQRIGAESQQHLDGLHGLLVLIEGRLVEGGPAAARIHVDKGGGLLERRAHPDPVEILGEIEEGVLALRGEGGGRPVGSVEEQEFFLQLRALLLQTGYLPPHRL